MEATRQNVGRVTRGGLTSPPACMYSWSTIDPSVIMLIDSSGVKEAQVAVALVDTAESKTQRIDHHRWTFIPPTQQRSHYPPVTSYCAIDLVVGDDGDGAQERVLQYLFENTYSHVVSIVPIFRGGIRRLGVKKRTHDRERSATSKHFEEIGPKSWPDLLIAWLAKRKASWIPSRI